MDKTTYVISKGSTQGRRAIRHAVAYVYRDGNTHTLCGRELINAITDYKTIRYIDCQTCAQVLAAR